MELSASAIVIALFCLLPSYIHLIVANVFSLPIRKDFSFQLSVGFIFFGLLAPVLPFFISFIWWNPFGVSWQTIFKLILDEGFVVNWDRRNLWVSALFLFWGLNVSFSLFTAWILKLLLSNPDSRLSDWIQKTFQNLELWDTGRFLSTRGTEGGIDLDILCSNHSIIYMGRFSRELESSEFKNGAYELNNVFKVNLEDAVKPYEDVKKGLANQNSFLKTMIFPKEKIENIHIRYVPSRISKLSGEGAVTEVNSRITKTKGQVVGPQ